MKKWEVKTINGKAFDVNIIDTIPWDYTKGYNSIHEAYGKPSFTKICIWDKWVEWFYKNDGYCKIVSRNSNYFSIAGYVVDSETKDRYYCYITYANQRAWLVKEN